MNDGPVRVISRTLDPARIDKALATVRALLPPDLLVLVADHLDAMKQERAMGDLRVDFHMNQGEIRSCSFHRETEWKRHEAPEDQTPMRAKS